MKQVLLLFLLLSSNLQAQNLVRNPSFENNQPDAVVVPCEFTQFSYDFGRRADVWNGFRDGTPDLLRAADNCPWFTQTRHGEQCLGIITYLPAEDVGQRHDFHEFAQGQLSAPLKPGLAYQFECWVLSDSNIAQIHLSKVYDPKTPVKALQSGNLGICFSVAPFGLNEISTGANATLKRSPQINFPEIIQSHGQWVKCSATFVPDQPFQYFTIGNFFPDRLTPNTLPEAHHKIIAQKNALTASVFDKIKRVNYMCIDDISLKPNGPPPPQASIEKSLLKDKKYTFNAALLFDSGKSELRPEALPALDSLVDFLQKYPAVILGISGHTDDVGSLEYNQELSINRAQAVQLYLETKGLPANRLRSRGFGESRPVADNLSETGRQANRRVECIVLGGG